MIIPPDDRYPFKWWLLTLLVVAPFMLIIYYALTDHFGDPGYGIILVIAVSSLGYSIPAFLVVICVHFLLKRIGWTMIQKKMALTVVACAAGFITFYLIGGSHVKVFSQIYCASLLVASAFLKYKSGDREED